MKKIENIEVTDEENDLRLDRWFSRRFPHLKFVQVQKLVRTGQVRVDGKRAKANQRVAAGQIVRVPPLPDAPVPGQRAAPSEQDAKMMKQMVLYQDKHIIALNKPPGLAVQGGSKIDKHIDGLLDALAEKGERPHLVHRLDRDTSGVLLLARNANVAAKLGEAFRGRDVRKYYWAVTLGVPAHEAGKIDTYLVKAGGRGDEKMAVATKEDKEAKKALTFFRILDRVGKRAALVAFWPKTGRTHQLRVHATVLETPILGDVKYGGAAVAPSSEDMGKGLHLHARRLMLPHPVEKGKTIDVTAPLPPQMKKTLSALGLSADNAEDPFEDVE